MKKIAILGVGAIGGIMGGYLTKGGEDVTLICTSWRENMEAIKKNGLRIKSRTGEETIPVRVVFLDDLSQLNEKFDILFIAVKSYDTVKMLNAALPYLAPDAWVISIQNGVNEDLIVPLVGKANVIGASTLWGGALREPGIITEGGGGPVGFIIGELDGEITPRIKELAEILNKVRKTEITSNIMLERWNKLSQVTMSGPVGAVSGLGLREVFQDERSHRVLALVLTEVTKVASALGYKIDTVMRISVEDWKKLAKGPQPEVEKVIAEGGAMFPPNAPVGILSDIMRGRPLELDYTTGYVIKKGKEVGVPTTVNELLLGMVKEIQAGKLKPSLANLDKVLEKAG